MNAKISTALLLAISLGLSLLNCSDGQRPAAPPAVRTALPKTSTDVALGSVTRFKQTSTGYSVTKEALFGHVGRDGSLSATKVQSPHTLRFGPAMIRFGTAEFSEQMSAAELTGEGNIERHSAHVRERIESRPGGVELTWTFPTRPENEGEVIVAIPILGESVATVKERGVRFEKERIHVDEGTFIDALGKRTVVKARLAERAIEYVVPASVIAGASFPATLDPVVSAEHEVDPASVFGQAAETLPSTASRSNWSAVGAGFDGTNYLVAWYDFRAPRPQIVATRVTQAGEVIDKSGIVLGQTTYLGLAGAGFAFPGVAVLHSKNGGYLVMWLDMVAAPSYFGIPIMAARLGDDGKPVGSAFELGKFSYDLKAGATDNEFVVLGAVALSAAVGGYSYSTVYDAIRVSGAKQPVSVSRVENAAVGAFLPTPTTGLVASAGEVSAFAITETSQARGLQKVTFVPGAVATTATIDSNLKVSPRFATRVGSNFAVFGYADEGGFAVALYNDTNLAKVGVVPLDHDGYQAFVDDVGVNLYGYCQDLNTNCICRYSTSFVPKGCTPAGDDSLPSAIGSSTRLKALTGVSNLGELAIGAQVFSSATGTEVAPPALLTTSINSQATPSVVYDAEKKVYVAFWVDARGGDDPQSFTTARAIFAATIKPEENGTFTTGQVKAISDASGPFVDAPRAARVGQNYFVTWEEVGANGESRIVGRTLALTDQIEPSSFVTLAKSTAAHLARPVPVYDGVALNVAWIEQIGGGTGDTAHSVLVKHFSSIPDQSASDAATPFVLSGDSGKSRVTLTGTFDGKQTLFVWDQQTVLSSEIWGASLLQGQSRPSSLSFPIADRFGLKLRPSISTDGATGSLVVWQELAGDATRNVFGKLIGRDEPAPKDTYSQLEISANFGRDESDPTVAYANDEESYFVAWSDRRDPKAAALYGNWVTREGRVLSPSAEGEAISGNAEEGNEELPFAATGPESRVGLIYSRFDARENRGALRAHFRTVYSGVKNGTPCTDEASCASRLCVEGVCCNSQCNDGCGTCGGPAAGPTGETATVGICSPFRAKVACGAEKRNFCDGVSTSCDLTCRSNDDCARPSLCVEGKCSQSTPSCADETHASSSEGPVGCGNYRCDPQMGTCRTRCETVDECAPGLICDFTNQCSAPPTIIQGEGSCALRANGYGSRGAYALAGVVFAASLLRRRRAASPNQRRPEREQQ